MASKLKVIRVTEETDELLRSYASERGVSLPEAAAALVKMGTSRRGALDRYAEKQAAPRPARKKRGST